MPEDKKPIEILVTDKDRQMAAQDTYTSRLFGKFAPEILAAGFRPDVQSGAYMASSEQFSLGPGRGRLGFLPDGNGSFDVVEVKDGQVIQFDDKSGGLRKKTAEDIMGVIGSIYRFRYDQLMNDPTVQQAAAQTPVTKAY